MASAIEARLPDAVEALLDWGMDVNRTLLLDHGADINGRNALGGSTPLMEVTLSTPQGETAAYLAFALTQLERGADPNLRSTTGTSALMFAVMSGKLDLAKLLVQGGADTNVRTRKGESVVSIARQRQNPDMVQLIESHGARP